MRRRPEDTWAVKAGMRSFGWRRGVGGGGGADDVCTCVVCIFLCFAGFVLAAGCRRSSAVRAAEPDRVVRPHTQLVCQEESNLEERTTA